MTSKYTPGPWKAVGKLSGSENHRGYSIVSPQYALAIVQPIDTDGLEGLANAHLIAAAPELLRALEDVVSDFYEYHGDVHGAVLNACTAIAKARGVLVEGGEPDA